MHRLRSAVCAAILMAGATPVNAENATDAAREQFSARLAVEQRLQDIGWRLVSGNARFCDGARPAIGLQLHDMASYSNPAAVRRLFGLSGDFAVLTSARGSPAGEADLPPNTEIAAIDGQDPNAWPAKPNGDWRRAVRAHDLIDAQLAENGVVELTLANGEEIRFIANYACPTRFELGGDGKRALADGSRVIVERGFPGLGYADDELAAALAHELAHNLLRHRKWLDRNGRGQRNIRLTEREADRLMPWLLANAGYQPDAVMRFMERWGPRHSGGIFRKRTHDGWDERVEAIAAEVAKVNNSRDQWGAADWRTDFVREVGSE